MFIQVIQAPCTKQDEVRALGDRWAAEVGPGATGWLGGTYGFTDDGKFVAVVRFESREAAMANSERPEQGAWFAEMEQLIDGTPEFHDCDDVTLMFEGGSDDAGFVQIIQGKVADRAKLKEMMADTDGLREMRPDILGGTLAIDADDHFTQTVAFTSEDEARKYEQSAQMPEDMARDWDAVMKDVSYIDLHKPWFTSAG